MSLHSFIQRLSVDDMPTSTQACLIDCVRDILGVAAGARQTRASQALREYAVTHHYPGTLSSRLLFDGRQVHPLGAAWAGGFCIDSLDAHEGHFTSKGHAGASVVPAVLALVDACRDQGRAISGRDFLATLAIGYETALRAGQALMATAPVYHASGAFSALGVVCAGARLLEFDETRLAHALGIAEYFAPRCPMMRLIDHPSMLRDAHGAGAHAGINALLLAQAGVTGSPAELVTTDDAARFWGDLGERWEIEEQYFKPWPVCRWAQPALTAVEDMQVAQTLPSVEFIASIRVETFHESMRLQGHTPASVDEAQYGLAFPLAALICRGQLGPEEVSEQALLAEDIRALSSRIEIVESAELSRLFPEKLRSRVCITTVDGQQITSPVTASRGDPERPMSREELRDKFFFLAQPVLGGPQAQCLSKVIESLPEAEHCGELLGLVMASPGNWCDRDEPSTVSGAMT